MIKILMTDLLVMILKENLGMIKDLTECVQVTEEEDGREEEAGELSQGVEVGLVRLDFIDHLTLFIGIYVIHICINMHCSYNVFQKLKLEIVCNHINQNKKFNLNSLILGMF